MYKDYEGYLKDRREEDRKDNNYPTSHIKVKPTYGSEYCSALIINNSKSSLSLRIKHNLTQGTQIKLNMDDTYFATGEVIGSEMAKEYPGSQKVGIHFIDKTHWPF